ncbi:MAG: AbrB/MazE/SpoVT family DNA-binding domain-containing protein [Thermoplasmata archaeon]
MVVESYSKVTTNYVVTIPIAIRKVYPIALGDIMRVSVVKNGNEPMLRLVKAYTRVSPTRMLPVDSQNAENPLQLEFEDFAIVSINYRLKIPAKLLIHFRVRPGDITKFIYDENEKVIKVIRSQ